MDRRRFVVGLIGGLAAAAGLAGSGASPAHAAPMRDVPSGDRIEAAELSEKNLDGVLTEHTQYYRRRARRVYRRYYRRPARRYYRRARRRYWRGRYYYY